MVGPTIDLLRICRRHNGTTLPARCKTRRELESRGTSLPGKCASLKNSVTQWGCLFLTYVRCDGTAYNVCDGFVRARRKCW